LKLTNYVIQQDKKCKCPICRDSFLLNNIYVPIKNPDDIEKIIIKGSKLNKLKNILYNENNKNNNEKIIIVSQYKDNIKIKNEIEENYDFFNLFYKNNNLNNIKKESFVKNTNKSILLCNYFDIIDYKFDNINTFIFIDYPIVEELKDIFIKIKNMYIDLNNDIDFYFLYIENTFEEKIISGIF
jgi:glycerophosphoryl diester phosphodiesterase